MTDRKIDIAWGDVSQAPPGRGDAGSAGAETEAASGGDGSDGGAGPEGIVVRGPLGAYAGALHEAVAVFKGIAYAQAPFGDHRFAAPQPVGPHGEIRRCLDFGPTAPKPPYPAPIDTVLSEPVIPGADCLNLNVWTPERAARTGAGVGLPVLVWIHGGAFAHGSGGVSSYDGGRFARDGVVCVTINYRLGVDGFLLLDGVPANRGLLDQVAALEWVRDNIAAFGGDPARVTVAGESAGAMSISTLMAIPAAAGLFRQAITQSGAAAHVISETVSRRVTAELAATLGIEPTAEAFAAVGLDALIAAQQQFSAALASDRDPQKWAELVLNAMPFEPTIDGEVLPAAPLELIRQGAGRGVRLLTGTNREEMALFLAPAGILEHADEGVLELTAGFYGLAPADVEVYRRTRPEESPGWLLIDVVTDWFFRIPAIRMAEARGEARVGGVVRAAVETAAATGDPEVAGEPTYLYEFGWRSPIWDGRLRSGHAVEIPFVFDVLDDPAGAALIGEAPPQTLADQVHGAWVAFVTTGEPGWPAYAGDRTVMAFAPDSDPAASGPVDDPRGETRAVWAGRR